MKLVALSLKTNGECDKAASMLVHVVSVEHE